VSLWAAALYALREPSRKGDRCLALRADTWHGSCPAGRYARKPTNRAPTIHLTDRKRHRLGAARLFRKSQFVVTLSLFSHLVSHSWNVNMSN
jgi:hypothetical protein